MDFTQTGCKDYDWVEMGQERTPVVRFSDSGNEHHGI
jgi:hypothetical protein